jgi:hypothetical protein
MAIATSVVQIIASVLGYLAARGIDAIIGKWVAYFVIAWEKAASDKALAEFKRTKDELIKVMPEKWKEWDDWRKKRPTP